MENLTDNQVIALALNAILGKKFNVKLRDIVVSRERKLFNLKGTGWGVHLIYQKVDKFGHGALTIEVDESGSAAVFQNM